MVINFLSSLIMSRILVRWAHNWTSKVHKFQSPHLQREQHRYLICQDKTIKLPQNIRVRGQQSGTAWSSDSDHIRQLLLQEPGSEEGSSPLWPATLQWWLHWLHSAWLQHQPKLLFLWFCLRHYQDGRH